MKNDYKISWIWQLLRFAKYRNCRKRNHNVENESGRYEIHPDRFQPTLLNFSPNEEWHDATPLQARAAQTWTTQEHACPRPIFGVKKTQNFWRYAGKVAGITDWQGDSENYTSRG